jgi:tyrosyl-tRNA synthetase
MKNVLECLRSRGLVDALTSPELEGALEKPIRVYVGFDPTADSLHLGNLMGIVALSWFQRFGHTPYVILGGATGRIGDPSGKSQERPLLDAATLDRNVESIRLFFHQVLRFDTGPSPVILNNNDWFAPFCLIDFLRDVGKHFRLGPMLAKEMVRTRLQSEEGISYTEFSYQILQGYDFHYLNRHHGVTLQMGGSDQWGNITAGLEFHRKMGGESLFGRAWPLITRSDGKKFGKTEEGAIWLSSHRLSPYLFFQHLFRIPDADVISLMKKLTFLPLAEIEALEKEMGKAGYVPNTAQRKFAEEVTRFVHGEEGLALALRVTEGMAPGAIETSLSRETFEELVKDLPPTCLPREEVVDVKFVDVAVKMGLISSKSEGVRLVNNGGAYLNQERISDPGKRIAEADLVDGKYLLLSAGKKKRMILKVEKDLKNIL